MTWLGLSDGVMTILATAGLVAAVYAVTRLVLRFGPLLVIFVQALLDFVRDSWIRRRRPRR